MPMLQKGQNIMLAEDTGLLDDEDCSSCFKRLAAVPLREFDELSAAVAVLLLPAAGFVAAAEAGAVPVLAGLLAGFFVLASSLSRKLLLGLLLAAALAAGLVAAVHWWSSGRR